MDDNMDYIVSNSIEADSNNEDNDMEDLSKEIEDNDSDIEHAVKNESDNVRKIDNIDSEESVDDVLIGKDDIDGALVNTLKASGGLVDDKSDLEPDTETLVTNHEDEHYQQTYISTCIMWLGGSEKDFVENSCNSDREETEDKAEIELEQHNKSESDIKVEPNTQIL